MSSCQQQKKRTLSLVQQKTAMFWLDGCVLLLLKFSPVDQERDHRWRFVEIVLYVTRKCAGPLHVEILPALTKKCAATTVYYNMVTFRSFSRRTPVSFYEQYDPPGSNSLPNVLKIVGSLIGRKPKNPPSQISLHHVFRFCT